MSEVRKPGEDDLEARLAGLSAAPDAALRGRVLGTVGLELARAKRQSRWRFGVGLAAALLIGLNLSLAMPAVVSLERPTVDGNAAVLAEARSELPPELASLGSRELLRERILLAGGSRLLLTPALPRPAAFGGPANIEKE